MTNEELAQQGDIMGLYQQNKGIIARYCYVMQDDSFTFEDLQQEAYFALVKAVKSWKPDCGHTFLTYLSNAIKWHFSRYKRYNLRKEGLPLDVPANEEADTTRAENIRDDSVNVEEMATEKAYLHNMSGIMREALDALPDGWGDLLWLNIAQGITLKALASERDVSPETVRQQINKGLRRLRRNMKLIRAHHDEVYSLGLRNTSFTAFKHNWASSVELAVIHTL